MPPSLQDRLDATDDVITMFRNQELDSSAIWDRIPDEYTHWIEEQKAWRDSCVLMDQSYHLIEMYFEGDGLDAGSAEKNVIELFSDLGVNSFEGFKTGDAPQAKQLVMCNSDGYLIGDCILFHLATNRFLTVGLPPASNWLRYNVATGDYDVNLEVAHHPFEPEDPSDFRFELMGPNSIDILEEVADDPLPKISFFNLYNISINGHDVYALGHQMSGEKGVEFFGTSGSYEYHDEIKETVLEAGEEYGLKQLGSKAYLTTGVESAWVGAPIPAIYSQDEFQEYREWLDASVYEANLAISGSFNPDDISDFYLTPSAVGYDRIVNFDHEFIGKEALEAQIDDPDQAKVTLVWDHDDVLDVHQSLYSDGDTKLQMQMPDVMLTGTGFPRYDTVLKNGETVGVSKYPSYNYNERELLSLTCIDVEYSEPGTEVTVVWGEEDTSRSNVERHDNTKISATVAPAPYINRGRRTS